MTSKAIVAMNSTPRCGARTRKGEPCKAPAVGGRGACRMHMGGGRAGAPRGNTNALRHGQQTARARALRRNMQILLALLSEAARRKAACL